MKNKLFAANFCLCFILFLLTAIPVCAQEPHVIPYDKDLETLNDDEGADAFNHAMDHPESTYFIISDYYDIEPSGSLHIIPNFATYQQTTEYTCGCACALMVLSHFGDNEYNEIQIGELVEVDTQTGTKPENLAAFFENIGYSVDSHASLEPRFETPEEAAAYLIAKIDAGVPVMIDWADWGGHWETAIGFDTMGTESVYDDVIIFADPYDISDHYQDGYYSYPFTRFFSMWHEGCGIKQSGLFAQPFVAAWPEEK